MNPSNTSTKMETSVEEQNDVYRERGSRPGGGVLRVKTLAESLAQQNLQIRSLVTQDNAAVMVSDLDPVMYRMHSQQQQQQQQQETEHESDPMASRGFVRFDSIEIHEHPIILGCNPAVTHGPPLDIDWQSLSRTILSVDEYETNRPPRCDPIFRKKSKIERRAILKGQGFSSEEFASVERDIRIIQQSREKSALDRSDLQAMMQESRARRSLRNTAPSRESVTHRRRLVRHMFQRLLRRPSTVQLKA